MKKRLVALLLAFSLSFCMCISVFAADTGIDIIDNPLSYYFQNQLLGVQKGTGVTLVCPNGDYKVLYTGGTLVTCPYDGEALVLADAGGVTAKKAPSGIGRKDLPGYADDNGTPSVNTSGVLQMVVEPYCITNLANYSSGGSSGSSFESNLGETVYSKSVLFGSTGSGDELKSTVLTYQGLGKSNYPFSVYKAVAPVAGNYYLAAGTYLHTSVKIIETTWKTYEQTTKLSSTRNYAIGANTNQTFYFYFKFLNQFYDGPYRYQMYPITVYCDPLDDSSITTVNNITITNNNYSQTWNGNIYVDNSNNLTYIYPEYTTINENNETVTNISNNPIIYNNETQQYYTYDTVTNNYYYITYNDTPSTPTPSPSPSPTPAPDPSQPTPAPTPGGDTGDATGILAVLVEIRDNMIQGFLDLKATLVQGWANLSANFTLAIENLNLNITNIFNKKFPDQSTPETAAPSPSPSPSPSSAPVEPILPDTQNYIIPKMNSNTFTDEHGTWIASGSSRYSDVFDFFRAFDRSTELWETNVSPSNLQIEIADPENYYIDGYIMKVSKFTNRYAKEWTLQGSDDGETWNDLDTQTGQNLSDQTEHKYSLALHKSYKYYRLNMSNYASSMCSLSHFNLLGYDAKDVVTPTPSPSPAPDPSATPTPIPAPTDKPSGGDKTNNFWTIIFPSGGDDSSGEHKGIFWALVSLILALIAFFTNLAAGVGYLFPFLPDGVVLTINTCLFVIFLFVIVKFIMRSK